MTHRHNREPISFRVPGFATPVFLDKKCWCCGGTGTPREGNEEFAKDDGTCEACYGAGFQLTEAGVAIFGLILRHSGAAQALKDKEK